MSMKQTLTWRFDGTCINPPIGWKLYAGSNDCNGSEWTAEGPDGERYERGLSSSRSEDAEHDCEATLCQMGVLPLSSDAWGPLERDDGWRALVIERQGLCFGWEIYHGGLPVAQEMAWSSQEKATRVAEAVLRTFMALDLRRQM